jgi:hypothetical protein
LFHSTGQDNCRLTGHPNCRRTIGLVTAAFAFFYGIYIFGKAFFIGDPVPGFPSLMIMVAFLGGLQLTVLGVIGEYLGRVFNETKGRPLYFLQDVIRRQSIPEADRKPPTQDREPVS